VSFRKDFVWGAAAASYQIEGAAFEDGKGLSVWDMYCRQEGRIFEGHTGEVACDHYHRYAEDVALMKQMGLAAYRLSICWPRVLPAGVGAVNAKGLEFYDRLVDELLAAGIEPWVTLFHWDYPYELYCRGGWLSPESSDWFAEYTRVVVDALSDRVSHWMTLNEPQCFIGLGHDDDMHAPGVKLGFAEVLRACHNVLLSHGKAVQVIRAHGKKPSIVGYAPVAGVVAPATNDPADVEAARRATFAVDEKNIIKNAWWSDPVMLGHYPQDGLELFAAEMPPIADGDMETIAQPLDFYGGNHYRGLTAHAGPDGQAVIHKDAPGCPATAFKWPVTPECFYWLAKFLYERYEKPIVITENGMANVDWVSLDGKVHDPQRIDYTARYLKQLKRAVADGVDVAGYFHWSLMDNFEWAEGYSQRFGLVHVDYATQKRTLKDSALWYRDVIASNGEDIDGQ